MAVLAVGQEYASLVPPITHDGQAVAFVWLSPDNRTLLTLGKDYTARLWDTRTARPIAALRKGDERVVNCGFSPDGRTVFTDDQTSVARFWDVPTGRFRTAIEARQNRYAVPGGLLFNDPSRPFYHVAQIATHMGGDRLLTRGFVGKVGKNALSHEWVGAVELWDSATGRLVARLDAPGRDVQKFQFLNSGRWVTTLEGNNNTVLVFSAEDGRLLARLNHPAGEVVEQADVGPSGREVATLARLSRDPSRPEWYSFALRVWDTETWQTTTVLVPLTRPGWFNFRFLMDDAFGGRESVVALGHSEMGVIPNGWTIYRSGQKEPIAELLAHPEWPEDLMRAGNLVHGGNGRVYDIRTWQRLLPPPGRKFHPDLARFAPDGRFVRAAINGEQALIDTRTDKSLSPQGNWGTLPKFGMIQATTANYEATIRLLPPAARLDIPADLLELWAQVAVRGEIGADSRFVPFEEATWERKRQELAAKPAPVLLPPGTRLGIPADLLELWAQVAVRGELGPEGQFVKWNEPTWERKRQELAAKPAPYPDFPFPGHVATDKLHWLRQEYEGASDADKPRLAKQLLDRAEAAGDKAEAVRWQAILTPKPSPTKPAAKP
jgi:WD40 repeat protein